MTRKSSDNFTARQRDEIFRNNVKVHGFPVCYACKAMIKGGQFQADHITPVCKGGKTEVSNGDLICLPCHKPKSAEETKWSQEADRKGRKDRGSKPKTSRPMPGSKLSGLKRKMDGTVVPRER